MGSNTSGGLSSYGLNITTRVSYNLMDVYRDPNRCQFTLPMATFLSDSNLQSVFSFTVPWICEEKKQRLYLARDLSVSERKFFNSNLLNVRVMACDACDRHLKWRWRKTPRWAAGGNFPLVHSTYW
jgi:hypothetical protein